MLRLTQIEQWKDTIEQRVKITQVYYKNRSSNQDAFHTLRTIEKMLQKF